jgi:hypothetical protein
MTDRAVADERERYRTLCAGKEASDIHAFISLQARVWEGKGLPDRCALGGPRKPNMARGVCVGLAVSPFEIRDSEGEKCV